MIAADGRVVWIRDHLRVAPAHLAPRPPSHGVMLDITYEKQAAAELRAQRDLNAGVLDGIEALVVLLAPDGQIVRTNRGVEQITGRTARALAGRAFASSFAHETDRERVQELLARAARSRGRAGCETRLKRREGDERVLAWSFTALRDESGAAVQILATGTDLTERLGSDRALRELDHELRHARRLDSLGRLASGVAHDFNNVLTAIIGYADVLAEDIADRPAARALALEIQSAAEQAAMHTRQHTTLARKGGAEMRPVDPRQELTHMRDLLTRSIGEDIVLDLQLDAATPSSAATRARSRSSCST